MNVFSSRMKPNLTFYLQLIQKQRLSITVYLFVLLSVVGLQLPIPFILSDIIDGLATDINTDLLEEKIWLIVGLSVLSLLLSVLGKIYGSLLNKRFFLDIRLIVFEGLQKMPLWISREYDVTDLQARFVGDVNVLNHLLPTGLANLIRHVFFVLAYGAVLIYSSSTIMLYILGFLPLAVVIFVFTRRRLSTLSDEARVRYAQANAAVYESLKGLREGRITGSSAFQLSRLAQSLNKSETKIFHTHSYSALMVGLLGVIPTLATATIWLVGGEKVSNHEMTVGQLVSIMLVLSMLYGPISGLFEAASGYVYERVAFNRIADLLKKAVNHQLAPLSSTTASVLAKNMPLTLELRDLDFTYQSTPIFNKFNATIPAGLCTALVGANGVGKTTLVSLITGLDCPSSGAVYLNQVPLLEHSSETIAQHYGYVPQNVLIFADSLRINITMGRAISDDRIDDVLVQLGWEDFLTEWEYGLDTAIAEGGQNLSGGQKQKIALLRALVNKPSVLVLDEPENNLEKHSVEKLVRYLEKIKGQCTVVLVTHGTVFQGIIDKTLEWPHPNERQSQSVIPVS